jgi:hypothetical protein
MDSDRKTFAVLIANLCIEAGVSPEELARITLIEFCVRLMHARARRGQRTVDMVP